MTNKLQSILAGAFAGLSGFLGWLFTITPEAQNAFILPFVELAPLDWRPGIGFGLKFLSAVTTSVAIYKAAQSGPQSPPKNKPE